MPAFKVSHRSIRRWWTKLSPDERADMVIHEMTQAEKIQLVHGTGWGALREGDPIPPRSNKGAGFNGAAGFRIRGPLDVDALRRSLELIARRTGVPPRVLDTWLWNRGQGDEYKTRPRHRTRCVFY